VLKTLNGALMIFTLKSAKVTSLNGIGSFKLCLRRMLKNTDLMFSMLLRSGHILTTRSFQSDISNSTEILQITLQRLNKLLMLLHT